MPTSFGLNRILIYILFAALAMSYGWGFRGDYGHEAGAMFPGAFLALAILIASNRADWQQRITPVALAAALGWAFGGSISYGMVIGYTAAVPWHDVAYGFTSLFVIGALWGSVGAGFLALALTMKRSWLNSWAMPLIVLFTVWQVLDFTDATYWLDMHYVKMDVDWVAAASALLVGLSCMAIPQWRSAGGLIATLATGWCLGFALLTYWLDIRMTPPRGDNWAGSVGLAVAFFLWLLAHRHWAALYLFLVGAIAGGYGFALGDGLNMMGRAGWGPVGELAKSLKLDAWKWMEQSFGFIMGLGVALGVLKLLQGRLRPPEEDAPPGGIQVVGLAFLLIVMPWLNFFKNVRQLEKLPAFQKPLFFIPQDLWYIAIAAVVSALIFLAILLYRRGKLQLAPKQPHGRAQLLLLFMMWLSVLAAFQQAMPHMTNLGTLWVHITFWISATLVSIIAILQPAPVDMPIQQTVAYHDRQQWRPGLCMWILLLAIPIVLAALTWAITGMHDLPLHGSHHRFK